MRRSLLFPVVLGLVGCGILINLGLWQVDRLAWKEAVLADIDGRLAAAPKPLQPDVTETEDEYTRVTFEGTPLGPELHVLVSGTAAGTGYLVVAPVDTDQGIIMVDMGLLPLDAKDAEPVIAPMQFTGTLLWPDDQNANTPEPDLSRNIWFARNVDTMSAALGTQPLLVVATQTRPADPRLTPLPVTTANIKNDHFEYAVTWFLLAGVWAIMSLYLIHRTLRHKDT